MSQFKIGDTVKIRPEFAKNNLHRTSTYTVVKINPRTLGLLNVATQRKMNADPEVLVSADVSTEALVEMLSAEEIPMPLDNGTVVRFKNALYVVTSEVAKGHRIFPLGGGTRYYTGVPASRLTVVPLTELAAALKDA